MRPSLRIATGILVKFAGASCVALVVAVIPARATIRYEISLAHPADHVFHVRMSIPDVNGTVVLQMPAWNALYQILDFSYHVTDFHASDQSNQLLPVVRVDKQTWNITGQGTVRVEYATYWNEPGPFGTELNAEHAFVNLAMVLCYVPGRRVEESLVRFTDAPEGWRVAMELPKAQASAGADYIATGYDALVDAPVEVGRFEEIKFQAAGRPIRAVVHGAGVDRERLVQQLTQIVEYESSLMGGAPFQEYMFIYHIGRDYGGGGMEHSNSTAIAAASAGAMLNVSAHEFFHLWNVKRIRPQSLEPVDYTKEMPTRALWFAEGVTNTYAAYTLVRTGLWTKAQFLSDLSEQITELESRPAHRRQSAEESSLNAWLEKYPLYNLPEFSISYYNKGQLLGVGLDILIRDATDNRASLDDVMRRLNQEYAQRGRFYDDSNGIRSVAEEVLREAGAGDKADLSAFFSRYVAGSDELPFDDWLSRAGFLLSTRGQRRPVLGFGISRNAGGAAVVSGLDLQSSAARGGIREDDVIMTLDGNDVARNSDRWLRSHQPGDVIRARVRRGDATNEITFTLGEQAARDYLVEEMSQPSERQRNIRNGLLQGSVTDRAR